ILHYIVHLYQTVKKLGAMDTFLAFSYALIVGMRQSFNMKIIHFLCNPPQLPFYSTFQKSL
ncbi:hypothetical protein EOQ10_11035, partial [Staphylococcus pseudintermedius]|nr:hypothetical protein [Staphylococcus pseudintermedius]